MINTNMKKGDDMEIVNTLYEQLNRKLKITKYDYSRDWLKKSKGYLAYIQSTKNDASLDCLFGLYGAAIRHSTMWEDLVENGSEAAKELYKEQSEYFRDIERTIEKEIRQTAATM